MFFSTVDRQINCVNLRVEMCTFLIFFCYPSKRADGCNRETFWTVP